MAVYFVQHGLALTQEDDDRRPLSEQGEQEVLAMAGFLRSQQICPKRIVHSGKLRARQTAELMAGRLAVTRIETAAGMAPKDDAEAFAAGISADETLYIGHLPHLQKVVSCLVTGEPDAGVIRFTNAGVVCLERRDNHFEIVWYVVPGLC